MMIRNSNPALRFPDALHQVFPLVLAALVFIVYVNVVTSGLTAVPGAWTDARFNSVILEHLHLWARGDEASLWRPDFFYPYPETLTFSDNHFGSGAIYVLARFAGLGREDAYTTWYLLGTATSFLAAYVVFQRLGLPLAAAGVGAIIFAFSGTMLIRTEHSQLIYRFATPLATYFAWRFLNTARLKHLALLALFGAWQFLCSVYLGVFLVLFLIGAGLGVLIFRSSRTLLFSLRQRVFQRPNVEDIVWLAIGSVFALAAIYTFARYALDARMYGFGRSPDTILAQQPYMASYLVFDFSPYYRVLGAWVKDDFLRHEKQMFIGGVAYLLMLASLLPGQRNTAWALPLRVLSVSLLFLVVVTLRFPGGFTLYWGFARIPGFSSIRAVGRVIEVILLPAGFIAAVGFSKAVKHLNRVTPILGFGFAALVGAGFLLETQTTLVYKVPRADLVARREAIRSLAPPNLPEDAVLVYRHRQDPDPYLDTDVDAMLMGQDLGRPVVNGYSGNFPAGYRPLRTCDDVIMPIAASAFYNHMTAAEANALLDRLVPVDFPDCQKISVFGHGFVFDDPSEVLTSTPLSPDLPSKLSLRVDAVRAGNEGLVTTFSITNSGSTPLPGNFASGANNIRFSWRYVRADDNPPQGDGWDTRAQLTSSVLPSSTVQESVKMAPPPSEGRFRLQVSMVQEQVMWLHDHGLEIATYDQVIEVSPTGTVRILPPE